MSPAKLAALLKDVFRQNEVCFITDDLLGIQENGSKSGYTVIGGKPTARCCPLLHYAQLYWTHPGQPRNVILLKTLFLTMNICPS